MTKENLSAGMLSAELASHYALLETLNEEGAEFEIRRNTIRQKIFNLLERVSTKKRTKVLRLAEDQRRRDRRRADSSPTLPLLVRSGMRKGLGKETYKNLTGI